MSSSFNPNAPKGMQYKPAPLPQTPAAATSDFLDKIGPGYKEASKPKTKMSLKKKVAIAGGIAAGTVGAGVLIKKALTKKPQPQPQQYIPQPQARSQQKEQPQRAPSQESSSNLTFEEREKEKNMDHYRDLQTRQYQYLADLGLIREGKKKDVWDKLESIIQIGSSLAPLVESVPDSTPVKIKKKIVLNSETGKVMDKAVKTYHAPGKKYDGHPVSRRYRLFKPGVVRGGVSTNV